MKMNKQNYEAVIVINTEIKFYSVVSRFFDGHGGNPKVIGVVYPYLGNDYIKEPCYAMQYPDGFIGYQPISTFNNYFHFL
jgi:hypothetical protein